MINRNMKTFLTDIGGQDSSISWQVRNYECGSQDDGKRVATDCDLNIRDCRKTVSIELGTYLSEDGEDMSIREYQEKMVGKLDVLINSLNELRFDLVAAHEESNLLMEGDSDDQSS